MPCGTFNIVNTGGRVRDVAPPQMCHSQSHHVTLGMTIGRSPRGEGPERDRERVETDGQTLDSRQRQSWWEEGAAPQGTARETGESGTLKGRSVHTHTDSQSNYHLMLSFNVINKYTLFKPSHCSSSDYGH